jgi:hypothetical protein
MPADTYDVNRDKFPTNVHQFSYARQAFAVVTDDNKDLTNQTAGFTNAPLYAKALYIGVAGDVKVTMAGDKGAAGPAGAEAPVVFRAAPVGILNVQARRVWATGTTATNILALTD